MPSKGAARKDKITMKLFSRKRKTVTSIIGTLLISMLFVACGSANGGGGNTLNGNGGVGCKKIGVLLPETSTSARWAGQDTPYLQQYIPATLPGATVDFSNAQGNADQQKTTADADLTVRGDCILVVAASDSVKAAQIVAEAKTDNVPVIAYDRLIQSNDLKYYVSFDNVAVGKLQGQYIADHYKAFVKAGKVGNVAMINGSQTDNNAILFKQGAHEALDPLYSSGVLKNVYEQFTPGWDNPTAQTEFQAALTANANNIQIGYVANDGMAATVIAALKMQNLNGRVLVTGQDATVAGLQNILKGDQTMTVFKNIKLEAQATANLVAAISNSTSTSSLTNGATTKTSGGADIPSVLEIPVAIDKTNVITVINAGGAALADVCMGLPSGTGGICP
jgi:D-xylose transport system substrate-binding protein